MTRVAVVDLGTNSTRLLVADARRGRLREVARRLTITRLGEAVDERRQLDPAARRRVEECLSAYVREADELRAQRRLAVATSAVRDAADGREFLARIEQRLALETRLLSGDEEALLTFRGVAASRPLSEETLVVDLGGGSTELIVGRRDAVTSHASLDLGCVRLTERFLHHDPPAPAEIVALRTFVHDIVTERRDSGSTPRRAIGVAGTVTTLATLDLGLREEDPALVDGHTLSRTRIGAQARRLAAATVSELRSTRGIHPDRAPVIAAGALAIDEILAAFGLEAIEVSETDILHGVALDLAD